MEHLATSYRVHPLPALVAYQVQTAHLEVPLVARLGRACCRVATVQLASHVLVHQANHGDRNVEVVAVEKVVVPLRGRED